MAGHQLNAKIDQLRKYLAQPNQNTDELEVDKWKQMTPQEAQEQVVSKLLAEYNNNEQEERKEDEEYPEEAKEYKEDTPIHLPLDNEDLEAENEADNSAPHHLAYNDLHASEDPHYPHPVSNDILKPENVKEIYGVEDYANPPNYVVDPNPEDYISAYVAAYENANANGNGNFDYYSAPEPPAPAPPAPVRAPEGEIVVSKETFNKMLASETGGYGLNGDDYPERNRDRGSLVLSDVLSAEKSAMSDDSSSSLDHPPIYEPYGLFDNQLSEGNLPQYPVQDPLPEYVASQEVPKKRGQHGRFADENFISLSRRRHLDS